MKKIVFAFLFSISFQVNAQWFWQNSSPQNSLYGSICFVDSNYGWIGGYDFENNMGIISRTTNGGTDWEIESYEDFWSISSVCFVDSLTGWAVGQNNPDTVQVYGYFIYKSTNGGKDWFRQPVSSDKLLWSVKFIDSNTGWAVGGDIIKTTDGGNIWEIQLNNSVGLSSVDFINSDIGWAVGNNEVILNTANGGLNWTYQRSQGVSTFKSVKFIDENIGWTVGDLGRIFKTVDGGTNWLLQRESENTILFSVSFVDENTGWVAGVNEDSPSLIYVLLKTTTGGSSWEEQSLPGYPLSYAVHFINENTGWVSGYEGAILKTTSGGVIPVELVTFSASVNDDDVILFWSTASETNNRGFEVQRKTISLKLSDGENSGDWEQIEFIDGKGTTTERRSYSYTDKDLEKGKYSYRIKQIDYDGSFELSNEVEVLLGAADKFALFQNYPNPFNPSTNIQYAISSTQFVTLKVYDLLGREVATLVNEEKTVGSYNVEFGVKSLELSSGIYFYKLQAGDFFETKKMLMIK